MGLEEFYFVCISKHDSMEDKSDYTQELLKLLLPDELFTYFEIVNIEVQESRLDIFLQEKNKIPEQYKLDKLTSKGFHPETVIQDFPIRNKPVYLHILRRRWQVESSKKVISRDWDTVAKGTRLTSEFATFLKGLLG